MNETDRKLKEIAKNDTKEYCLHLLDNFPTLIWCSGVDMRCNYFNKTWLKFTGRSMEQELGEGWTEDIYPDDLELCIKNYTEAFAKRVPFEMEYRLRRFDGEFRWVLNAGVPYYNPDGTFGGCINSVYDITERKLAEQAVVESEEKFRQLFHNSVDSIMVQEVQENGLPGKFIEVNNTVCSKWGFNREELLKSGTMEFLKYNITENLSRIMEDFRKNGHSVFEAIAYTKSGEMKYVEIDACYISLNGRKAYLSIVRDITGKKQAEIALKESQEKYQSLLMNMSNGFSFHKIIFDEGGTPVNYSYVDVNDTYEKIVGISRDNIIGKKVTEVIPNVDKLSPHWLDIGAKVATTGESIKLDSFYSVVFKRWYSIYCYSPSYGYFANIYTDITENKLAEDALRKSNEKYQSLFDHMISGFTYNELVIDEAGNPVDYIIHEVNEAYEKLTGMSRAAVVGKLASEAYNQKINPDWLEKCYNTAYNGENYLLDDIVWNERKKYYSTSLYCPQKGYFATMFYDTTDSVRATKELQASKAKYQTLLMNMNSGFGYFKVVCDDQGTPVDCIYLEVNTVFEDFMGRRSAEVIGKSIIEVSPFNRIILRRFMDAFKSVAIEGNSYKVEELYLENLNKWCSVFAYSPEKGYFAIIINDITEEHHSKELMIKAKEEAEGANKAKSEFLANMSHEIRTPLNGVIGMIDITLTDDLSGFQKENLNIAKNCANSLLRLIKDILDFSKIEAGKLAIENTNFNLKELIDDTVRFHTSEAEKKQLELNYMFSSSLPEFIVGDPDRLQQVLNNLIGNAIKFTGEGSITVSVKKIEEASGHIQLQFSVADTGIGIAYDDMDKLFKVFSQVDASHTRKYGGTGLGLAISRQLVELMGGTIRVESEMGLGSTFSFDIKFKIGERMNVETRDNKSAVDRKELHILLVEDDKVNQSVIGHVFRARGFAVDIAGDGSEALKYHEENKYDVILMDIQMPVMDGIEATELIREREGDSRHTPVIALTGYALKGDKERFLSMGMDDYISKPVDIDKLIEAIDRVCLNNHDDDVHLNRVMLDENGEVIFVKGNYTSPDSEKLNVVSEISGYVEQMSAELAEGNLSDIEKIAGKIKSLANDIEADELKNSAFRIELAARRRNLKETLEHAMKIGYEFETFKKTIM